MRVWPFSASLNADIGEGILHWIRDQFFNVKMYLLIRRSERVDRFVERCRQAETRDAQREKR